MPDRQFEDADLAALYDCWDPGAQREDFAFYLPRVMAARAVLDIGCGTGELLRLARDNGHTARLCGAEPADGMLAVARRRTDIEWVQATAASLSFRAEFDLAVMTGHAFQVLVDDAEIRASLTAIRSSLKPGGRFAFETRNPAARAWETWTPDSAVTVTGPDGTVARMEHQVEQPYDGRVVTFRTTFTAGTLSKPEVSRSTLRFLTATQLTAFLDEAGFVIDAQFGDWDRTRLTDTSPEIITVASRA